jgi:flagellin-like hook-associated protein FlgL
MAVKFTPTTQDQLNNALRLLACERARHGKVETSLTSVIDSLQKHIKTLNEEIEQLRDAYLGQCAVGLKQEGQ